MFCASANHQKFYTLSPHQVYYFFYYFLKKRADTVVATVWVGGKGLWAGPGRAGAPRSGVLPAKAVRRAPPRGCGRPPPPPPLPARPGRVLPGSCCKYSFAFPTPPPPARFRLAVQKLGNWGRAFGGAALPAGQANLVRANVQGVTSTVAAAWRCLTNSKACYTWATFRSICCPAGKLGIAVRHRTSPCLKLKHFGPHPNVYLHAFRYTDVNYQSGNESCSEYG